MTVSQLFTLFVAPRRLSAAYITDLYPPLPLTLTLTLTLPLPAATSSQG